MIFIFDWGHRTFTDYGFLTSDDLAESGDSFFRLVKVKYWFRAFFIPLIPTKTEYVLSEVKQEFVRPISVETFEALRPFAELNQQVADGHISAEAFSAARDELKRSRH